MADKNKNTAAPEAGAATREKAESIVEGKVKVNFGVHIPELEKVYSKDELECDQDAIDYLIEIKSKAITVISH